MPTYSVKAPDGSTLQFEGPEGATEAQIYAYAEKQYKPQAAPKPRAAPKPKGAQSWSPGFAAAVEKSFPSNELKRTNAPAAPVNPLLGAGRLADAITVASNVDPLTSMLDRNDARLKAQRVKTAPPPTIAADGQLDRMGSKFKQSVMRLGSGGARVLASGMEAVGDLAGAVTGTTIDPANIPGLAALRERTDNVDAYVGAKVEGAQDVGEFIKAPTLGGLGQIFLEGGAASIPDMVAMANPLSFGAYVTQAAGNIGQQRAENDGQDYANLANIVEALPAALGSAYAEKLGTKYLFAGGGGNPLVNVGKSILSEAGTEAAQSGIEYTGSNLGTEAGFDPAEAGRQMLEGGVAGGIIGGGIRGGTETADAAQEQVAKVQDRSIAKAEREAAAPVVDQIVRDMLNPTLDVQPAPAKAPKPAPVVAEIKPEVATPTVKADLTVAPEPAAPTPPSEAPPKPTAAPAPEPIAETPKASSPGPDGQGQQSSSVASTGLRPDPGPLADGEEYVYTPANGKIRTKLEVVSASDLKQAEGRNQNRDRSQAGTDIQVQGIISDFTPERLGRSAETDRGSPIVGMDGTIESGNGRAMALSKIYDNPDYADKAAAYRAFIESNGLSTEGFDRPVLIRRRTSELSEDQLRNFVVSSNKDAKLALTGTEQAKTDADNLTPERVALYRGGDIGKTENASFVREFLAQLTDGERGGLLDGKVLNATGARRLEGALLARAYDDTALLTNMIDSRDDNIRTISGALLDVVGPYSQFRNEVSNGTIRPEMDVNKQLVLAARKVSEARERNVKIGDMLSQIDAVDPIDPLTEQFIRAFYNADLSRAAGRASIGNTLRRFVELASEQKTGVDLLGDTKDGNAADIMAQVIKERDEQPADMFSQAADRGIGDILTQRSRKDMAGSDLYDALEAEEEQPYHNDNGAYGEKFEAVSFTSRISHYNAVAAATGVDPDKFRLLPSARQIFLMQKLIKERFNVTVTVDKQMQDRFAIDQMLDMVQNVEGMAHILGIGADAISLDGKLGLKLVKKARFLGSYQPGTGEITLPQRSNSFAHEWGHALDYYLQEQMTSGEGRGLSGQLRQKGDAAEANDAAPESVRQAFVNLLNTMFFDQAAMAQKIMALEARHAAGTAKQKIIIQKQLDALAGGNSKARDIDSVFLRSAKAFKAGSAEYWTMPTEMFARAFEAYVSFRADALGLGTEFIGKSDAAYLSEADERLKMTFPHGEERNAIFAAFDALFVQLNQEGMTGISLAPPRPEAITNDTVANLDKLAASAPKSPLAREIQAWKNFAVQRAKEKADRAPNQLNGWQRKEDGLSSISYSMTGRVRMIERRSGSRAVGILHDKLTYREGKGAYVGRTFLEATDQRRTTNLNRMANILRKHGMDDTLTAEQSTMLRDLLISEKADGAPANYVEVAAELRKLLDQEFYENQNVGIDIGYTRNGYLPRVVDLPKVDFDNGAFLTAAAQVYEIVFDNRFPSAKAVMADADLFTQLRKYGRRMGVPAFAEVEGVIKEVRLISRKIENADPEKVDALKAERDELLVELEELVATMMEEVKPIFASEAAEAWLAKINTAAVDDFDAHTPAGDYTKGRSLPVEADKIMEQFYISDPIEAIQTYIGQSAKRTEYARAFGAKGEKRKALFEQMAAEGVSRQDQVALGRILDIATGRTRSNIPQGFQGALSFTHAVGTMMLLPRAVISSLSESITAGLVTNDARVGVMALARQISGALGSANGKERAELARAMGIVSDGSTDDLMEARFGGQFGDVTNMDRKVSRMFKTTGLTALTRSQRTHLLATAQAHFDNLAGKILDGTDAQKRQATALLQELGIKDVKAFSIELRERGRLPTIEESETQYFKDFGTAANRLINMIIQNPTVMDRPELANNPVGRVMYGIMSFSYSFYRNIMKRQAIMFNETRKRNGAMAATAQTALGFLPAAAGLFIGQLAISTAREYLLNGARWDEWEKDEKLTESLIALALTRTFSFAGLDPLIQGYTGLKYQRDLANIFIGAAPGFILQNLQSIPPLWTRNSKKKNTAEYNATKSLYNVTVAPAVAFGLASMPGGPLVQPVIGAGIAYATSPNAGNDVATAINGPKGTKTDGNFLGLGEKPDKKKASKLQDDKLKAEIGF